MKVTAAVWCYYDGMAGANSTSVTTLSLSNLPAAVCAWVCVTVLQASGSFQLGAVKPGLVAHLEQIGAAESRPKKRTRKTQHPSEMGQSRSWYDRHR